MRLDIEMLIPGITSQNLINQLIDWKKEEWTKGNRVKASKIYKVIIRLQSVKNY